MKLISKEARIENTSKCNARCISCPREKMSRQKTTMPLDHFKVLVDQCKALGAELIQIGGYGEPLMDLGIVEKIAYVKASGIETFVTTNGSMLTDKMGALLIDAGLDNLRISIDGTDHDAYVRAHGLDYERLCRNLDNFFHANLNRGHKVKLHIGCLALQGTSEKDFVDRWEKYADFLEVWRPHNWVDGRDYRKPTQERVSCSRPLSGPLQINADGRVMVCCFDYDGRLTVGSTYHNTIEEILKGEAFERIRKAHESGDLGGLICSRCDQRFQSHGSPLLYRSRSGAANRRATA